MQSAQFTMKKTLRYLALAAVLSVPAFAQTATYDEQLTTNLGHIETIWETVAGIMIGVALVSVGVRFFRKAK